MIDLLVSDQIQPVTSREESNFIKKWTFGYFGDLLQRGIKRELVPDDYPATEEADKCEPLSDCILKEWEQHQNLWKVLWNVFGARYSFAGIFFLLELFVQLTQGFFLSKLLYWVAQPVGNDGYYYALGIALDSMLYALLHHAEWFITIRTGMQARVGLIAAIYQKCLALSISNTSSTGLVVNLVSNDVQRFEDASPFLHYIWITPLQLIGYMYLIYLEIGWSVAAAIISVFLLIPVQSFFGQRFKMLRGQTVGYRDERIKSLSDMLSGILIVKMYAWEIPFIKKITNLRNSELDFVWKGNILKASNFAFFFCSGVIINAITFTVFWLSGGELTAARVFSVLKLSITIFIPSATQLVSECIVSVKRIESFLSLPNLDKANRSDPSSFEGLSEDVIISIKNASFSWDSKENVILHNLDLCIKEKTLNCICGPVGSGKTSLLNALLGDMNLLNGTIGNRAKKVAYVSQTPWIMSGTIKDSILFGQEYDEQRFARVVRSCSLSRDFALFPNGADTFIGERGVTLSGGQRARVALARAVYYDADLYILDDPLSAVDTKVARHIFEECIQGVLKDKTVLLVTHQLQFVKYADQIIALEKGRIIEHGTFMSVMKSQTSFAETLREFTTGAPEDENPKSSKVEDDHEIQETSVKPSGFANEESAKGSIPLKTYYRFFTSGSSLTLTMVLLFAMTLGQALLVSSDFWLAHFASQTSPVQKDTIYIYVFVALAVATFVIAMTRAYLFFFVCLNSSKHLFEGMLGSVFRSPMSFFQANPHGRILNRFSKDINLVDETLPQVFFDLVQCVFILLGIIVVTCIVLPYLLLLYPILAYIFFKLRTYYMATSRQVKRIEAVTRSPVYSCIPSTLEGLSIIRAMGAEKRIRQVFFDDQDENTRMFFVFISSGRWLGMRLDFLVAALLTIILFVCVSLRSLLNISPSLLGLLLSYLLQMIGTLQWAVRQSSEVENLMVSAERVLEYTDIPSEAADITDTRPPKSWPDKGELAIENLSLTYPNLQNLPDNPPVLKNLNIHFEPGTKVGIVGRTGSGKSSFLQALFRIVEPTEKSVKLDGIYTSSLGLQDLRSRISIIPQEPFCFKGTLRFNLDPFVQYDSEKLWNVLKAVELKTLVESMPEKLESPVYENGSNWSVGERQLICLARAILRNSSLIVMDEATSSVDMHTDQLIQKAIRNHDGLFANSTVLTIAHRLNTVIDYDKIMVLDSGTIVEYGSPHELLQKEVSDPSAWFSRMVEEMGSEARDNLKRIAETTYHKKLLGK